MVWVRLTSVCTRKSAVSEGRYSLRGSVVSDSTWGNSSKGILLDRVFERGVHLRYTMNRSSLLNAFVVDPIF